MLAEYTGCTIPTMVSASGNRQHSSFKILRIVAAIRVVKTKQPHPNHPDEGAYHHERHNGAITV